MKKLLKAITCVMLLFTLTGCGSVPVDKSAAPFDYNLYTVEIDGCTKELGTASCIFNENTDLSKTALKLNLHHEGEVNITSKECGFAYAKTFDKETSKMEFSYDSLLEYRNEQKTCVYDIKVFVNDLDKGFRGLLVLLDTEEFAPAKVSFRNRTWVGAGSYQIRRGKLSNEPLLINFPKPALIYVDGCGYVEERQYEGNAELDLKYIFDQIEERSCVFSIGIIPNDAEEPTQLFSLNIQQFGLEINQLAEPSVKFKKNKYKVKVDPVVAGIKINNKSKIRKGVKKSRKMSYKASHNETVWIRIITANGRAYMAAYKNGKRIWTPSIQY